MLWGERVCEEVRGLRLGRVYWPHEEISHLVQRLLDTVRRDAVLRRVPSLPSAILEIYCIQAAAACHHYPCSVSTLIELYYCSGTHLFSSPYITALLARANALPRNLSRLPYSDNIVRATCSVDSKQARHRSPDDDKHASTVLRDAEEKRKEKKAAVGTCCTSPRFEQKNTVEYGTTSELYKPVSIAAYLEL